ncbi:small ribosomal subunit protein bS20c [Aristolochia californica]|uniref:small ribosomal subunit protein bS20c n=1 Tax=Aristolochia californica TaxID=171875 RepID=UPI0035DA25F2
MAIQCLAPCFALTPRPKIYSVNASCSTLSVRRSFQSLSFSTNLSQNVFVKGKRFLVPVEKSPRRNVVCEAAPSKKPDSAAKRARQAEKRRLYNKGKKSEMKTRMKKVLEVLDVLKKKTDAQAEEILPVEKLIAEAYSAIDKAVKAGSLHRNTGANRKSRLARRKKAVEIHHGWYTPAAVPTATEA